MWLIRLEPARCAQDVALRLARTPGLAWLDGGLEHGREGRYSFLSTAPCAIRQASTDDDDPWRALRGLSTRAREAPVDADLRPEDVPEWVGHVAYELGLGSRPQRHLRDSAVPALRFARYDAWVAIDHLRHETYLVGDDRAACEQLRDRLAAAPLCDSTLAFDAGPIEATPHARHEAAIGSALALIADGEVYEINLARRFRAPFCGSALGLFLRMRAASPVPLGYFVEAEEHAVLGRSMERYLRFRTSDRALWTSPIKGTLARAGDDAAEALQLRSDPKEHAEHAMVVDLMRNDLSRVCEVGSVEVSALMEVLPFAGLSHLISTVRGRVRPEVVLADVLAETFPPGSVTGTPKHRVLQAIDALEDVPRGLYTGCMGFVDRAGGCSLAVAIRTAVVEQGRVDYFSGGGIVAASHPARESAETDLKAALFLKALHGR